MSPGVVIPRRGAWCRARAAHLPVRALAGVLATAAASIEGCGGGGGGSKGPPTAPAPIPPLPLLATYAMAVTEPSDLTIDETGTILWTVSDSKNKVYKLDVQGNTLKTLAYAGGPSSDLEGVAYDHRDRSLWLAEEELRQVVHVDSSGAVLSSYNLLSSLTPTHNAGPEGICLDDAGRMFLLNERKPGMFISLDPSMTVDTKVGLTFARDYSGMTYDPVRRCFWVMSDESAAIYLCTAPNVVHLAYTLPSTKFEGLALDPAGKYVYAVNDSLSLLYVFQNIVPAAPLPSP
jgi:uncharacterized protein YjiK